MINPYGTLNGVKKLKGWKLKMEKERQILDTAKEIIKGVRVKQGLKTFQIEIMIARNLNKSVLIISSISPFII